MLTTMRKRRLALCDMSETRIWEIGLKECQFARKLEKPAYVVRDVKDLKGERAG